MSHEMQAEARAAVIEGYGWYRAAFDAAKKRFPAVSDAAIDDALAQCGVRVRACKCDGCGYQGSMSPFDAERLVQILSSAT